MTRLDPALEYLLWYEVHRLRWMAVPILREGNLILDSEYVDAVVLDLDGGE